METQLYGKPTTEQAALDLGTLKSLTIEQYDKARETAAERTNKLIEDCYNRADTSPFDGHTSTV